MPVTWKLNGNDIALLRLGRLVLELVNQLPDQLRFVDDAVRFDATLGATSPVISLALTAGGSSYTSVPTVSISGGGGTGAVATATLTPTSIASVAVTAPGVGYAFAPTVVFSGGGGAGAAATAVITDVLTYLGYSSGGSGYPPGTFPINFSTWTADELPTAQAHVHATGFVEWIEILTPGKNITSAPNLHLTYGGGSGCIATPYGWSGLTKGVTSISVTNPGSGYTSTPTISFTGGGGGINAAGAALLAGTSVASLTLVNGGSGYTSAPGVSFTGGGGSGATATATLATLNDGLKYEIDDEIVLTRTEPGVNSGNPVTWFRGHIRSTPRTASESSEQIAYIAEGPWSWFDRIPFLQNFKVPEDPEDVGSALVTYLRGRAVIAQDDAGTKVNLGTFLNEVFDYAADAAETYVGAPVMQRTNFAAISGLQITIPWDEVVDLSCAEVISRALQWLPDAVCWWDYTTNPPTLNINRRSALTGLSLPILKPGTASGNPFEKAVRAGFRLQERPDLQRSGVVLIYLKTHRANGAAWETYEIDDYPAATPPNNPDALVRTIQLAGAITNFTILEQQVTVESLDSYLTNTSLVTSGATFDSLSTWWKKHTPELRWANITIKGFRNGVRTKADGSALDVNSPNKELVKGAITDWMESDQDVTSEEQLVQVDCWIERSDPDDATKKERLYRRLSALIVATDASTKTYRKTEAQSFTPAEATPSGLAQAIYNAISVLQYDGDIVMVEREVSVGVLVGRKINITGGLTAWENMGALVQSATIDIDRGETLLRLGPPRQLGPDDLVELYRVNRSRQPVTSYWVRSSGKSGTSDTRAGLTLWSPVKAGGTALESGARVYTGAVSVAGVVPTAAEFTTALQGVYSGSNRPRAGDVVNLTISSVVKFRAVVTLTNPGSAGIFHPSFTVDSVTYYAQISQVGIY